MAKKLVVKNNISITAPISKVWDALIYVASIGGCCFSFRKIATND